MALLEIRTNWYTKYDLAHLEQLEFQKHNHNIFSNTFTKHENGERLSTVRKPQVCLCNVTYINVFNIWVGLACMQKLNRLT